ncbi:MAG: hypothetical protein QNJ90_02310 [Planctomycetota bacterium]|nr:hypothetical protein [Planctomycetota bacterium]
MAKDIDMGGKGDHLKYYCIVFGILVVVIAVVAFGQRSKLNAYRAANKQANAALKAQGTTPDGRPRGIANLAVEVEKFVQGYKDSLGGAGTEGGDGISTRMITKAGRDTQMKYQFAGTEQDDPNRSKGFRTRSREFTYGLSTLDQLTKLCWNIEALGRYRVFEIRWKLGDKRINAEPPFFKVNKPVIRVGYRSPLTKR